MAAWARVHGGDTRRWYVRGEGRGIAAAETNEAARPERHDAAACLHAGQNAPPVQKSASAWPQPPARKSAVNDSQDAAARLHAGHDAAARLHAGQDAPPNQQFVLVLCSISSVR